ncbi:hypothetical protein BBJ29_000082 [Phytophthora kernoviae]|uniref:Uncharacterized protein n=1 Tax=Phytophthora kernoviae TaxID=325452 RepID=A0A3F2S1E9_9STRA|nr:hypothetical protein BBJ29_000082 [Phytophthora kernoviae]RLN68473.1 hypothetical protein BBP00_00001041 [Phytophthora kernoviae]
MTIQAKRETAALVHPTPLSPSSKSSDAVLDFSNSYLGDDKFAEIVEKARLTSVPTRLDLRGNCFEAGAARALAALLRSSHNIVSISLEWNNVGLLDQGVDALADALEVDTRLVTLDLRNNNIGPEGAKAFAKALRRNRTLRQLDLRWNEVEKTEELEAQLQQARKDAEMAKEERGRYQQREVDAKRDLHELRMQLDELENRKKLEFEEYRSSRTALERENNVMREKMAHLESLHSKEVDQKEKQISQLEDAKYTLDNEIHRTTLTARTQEEEIGKLKKLLQDLQQEYARKEAKLVSDHESSLSAAQRQHDMVTGSVQTQLSYASTQLESSERSVRELKEKCEALQAKVLQSQIDHEKMIGELKQQWDAEVQERIQRSVGSVEAQVAEVKKSRQHLEREVEKHLQTIIQLRQDNISLQQASDGKQNELQLELEAQSKALQEKHTQLATATSEKSRCGEKLQLQLRRMEEQDARFVQMQTTFDERLQDLTSSAKTAAEESAASLKEKATVISSMENQVLRLERELSAQKHEHEKRIDDLAESFGSFVQEQIRKEREHRKNQSPRMDVRSDT